MSAEPELTVVVARISGRPADLLRCLQALYAQVNPPPFEILVPHDASIDDCGEARARFPEVRFLPVAGLDSAGTRAGDTREAHDTLRSAGLRAARGRFLALTEDHARMDPSWCRDMLRVLETRPQVAALGGAVECGSSARLNRAVWLCDFGRYQNPLPAGPAPFVSDSNVVYRREALVAVASSWEEDYHETVVHDALRAAGLALELTPASVVWQERSGLALAPALRERFVWGRSYAGSRVRARSPAERAAYALATPLLPLLLTARVVRTCAERGRLGRETLMLLPLVLLLHGAWAAGELAGYLRGRP